MSKCLIIMSPLKPSDNSEIKFLFEMFARRVYRAAYFVVRDRILTEDIVQETFLVAMDKLRDLRDPDKIEAWLIRIAVNKARTELRKVRKTTDVFPTTTGNPTEESFLAKDENKQLHLALEALPADLQMIIYLMYFQEMTAKQIAGMLDIPEGTVKSRIRKAYQLMRRSFKVRELKVR